MSKSSSVFVVTSGYYGQVEGAFTTLDAAKDFVLSDVLSEVLNGEKHLPELYETQINEMVGGDIVNTFEVSCQGLDFDTCVVKNRNRLIETLDIQCVTQR